jgi:protein-L-isoaspartate(D-aspartate) O-methyltransferase
MEKEELINELILNGYLKNDSLISAFLNVDRKDFVLDEYKNVAYENIPLPIGYNQTISQPLTVAFMLELLEPKVGEKVLEVGTGSGWQTALLAYLIKDEENKNSGKVISLERIKELKDFAYQNLMKYDELSKNIILLVRDGSLGFEEESPFDKIIVAAAADEIPQPLKEQLKIGGRMVIPVKNSIVVLDKISSNEFKKMEFFGFSFVPLVKDEN